MQGVVTTIYKEQDSNYPSAASSEERETREVKVPNSLRFSVHYHVLSNAVRVHEDDVI